MEKKIVKEMRGKRFIYKDERGNEISTYEETLYDVKVVVLEPLRDFLNMEFEGDEAQKMASIAGALLERAEKKIDVASDYIDEHHGIVKMVRASYRQGSVKPETIIDIVFIPCKEMNVDGAKVMTRADR